MMRKYRGIVCEKKASYSVFLTKDGEFVRGVPLMASVQIGDEAEFHLIASSETLKRMKPIFIAPALVAAVLLLFLAASWFSQTTTAYAYIQVEGDSTIEIGVNKKGKVISLQSATEEIKDWEGQSIDLVLAKAVEQVTTDKKELAVTTVYEKEDKPELKKQIEKAVKKVKKPNPSPEKNPMEPKQEIPKPPGQIKKEEKSLKSNKPATNKEHKNQSTEPVKKQETKDKIKDNNAQPKKDTKPTNNSNKVPGQEKKKNEVKSNNGNSSNKNKGNNNGNGNNKNSNN